MEVKLEDLGAKRFLPIVLGTISKIQHTALETYLRPIGDDQDPDGYLTAFVAWESQLWEYLGVSGDSGATVALTPDQIKINSNFLRGTIAQGLQDTSTGKERLLIVAVYLHIIKGR